MQDNNSTPQLNQLVEIRSAKTVVFAGIFPPGEMVSVRKICENLGLDRKWQQDRIKSNPELMQLGGIFKVKAADGKNYDTLCLNIRGLQKWLWSITDTPNLKKDLLNEYRKYLAIDIQEALLEMLKVSIHEIKRLKQVEENYKVLRGLTADMLYKQEELSRLTSQRRLTSKAVVATKEHMVMLLASDYWNEKEKQLTIF